SAPIRAPDDDIHPPPLDKVLAAAVAAGRNGAGATAARARGVATDSGQQLSRRGGVQPGSRRSAAHQRLLAAVEPQGLELRIYPGMAGTEPAPSVQLYPAGRALRGLRRVGHRLG